MTAVEWLEEQMKTWGDLPRWMRDDIVEKAKAMEQDRIISFGEWYSGMEKEKVQRAYNRYLNETTFKSE